MTWSARRICDLRSGRRSGRTTTPAGAIREIAFDNIHELTMDESGEEELDPPAALRLGEIDVPTLVMIAEHDPPYMRRCDELIAREVLDGRHGDRRRRPRRQRPQPRAFDAAVLPFLAEYAL